MWSEEGVKDLLWFFNDVLGVRLMVWHNNLKPSTLFTMARDQEEATRFTTVVKALKTRFEEVGLRVNPGEPPKASNHDPAWFAVLVDKDA